MLVQHNDFLLMIVWILPVFSCQLFRFMLPAIAFFSLMQVRLLGVLTFLIYAMLDTIRFDTIDT